MTDELKLIKLLTEVVAKQGEQITKIIDTLSLVTDRVKILQNRR